MRAKGWVVLMAMAMAIACAGGPPSSEPQRPNIVFVMVDDMGWADLGSYGSKAIHTPNLDRLASEGMRFTDAYAGHTVCAPSRCALMTGKHTGKTTVRDNAGTAPIRDADVTIAEVLQQGGYATGGFGKWGLGVMGSPGAAEKQGFDTFFGYYHQVHAHTYYPPFLVEDGKPFLLPGNALIYGLQPEDLSEESGLLECLQAAEPERAVRAQDDTEGRIRVLSRARVRENSRLHSRESRPAVLLLRSVDSTAQLLSPPGRRSRR